MDESIAYIALGANIGDSLSNMRAAVKALDLDGNCRVTQVSSLYKTAPVGYRDQPEFLNAVVELRTTLSPGELLAVCDKIERRIGRKRTIRWGPRVIDIDILLYDDMTLCDGDLVLPHPRMMERSFVLVPLAEIAPELTLEGSLSARDAARRMPSGGIELIEGRDWIE